MSATELDRNGDAASLEIAASGTHSRLSRLLFLFIASVICVIALAVFFRSFLTSGFNLIAGDLGDNRFNMLILEHWNAVFHGQAHFRSPNFYWPERGVLGYSDSLFLFLPPYLIGRAVGLDTYMAFEITLISLKAIGFFSMLWLLRSCLGVGRSVALVGSTLFTLSNLYFLSVGHGQLVAVVFVPFMVGLACTGWRVYGQGRKNLGYVFAGLLGILLAMVLFTSFYIGWFAILASGITLVVALLAVALQSRTLPPLPSWRRAVKNRGPLLAAALLGFSAAIIPFLVTYLPMLKRTGGRTFNEVLLFSAHPIDLINVGRQNWIWGRSLDRVMLDLAHREMQPSESQRGWPPLTLGLIVAGLALGLSNRGVRTRAATTVCEQPFLAVMLSASFLACWLLSLDVAGQSLWWFVFKFVPGGSAIRAPARFNLVLNIFAVAVVCLVLDALHKRGGRNGKIVFWALCPLVIAEQFNTELVAAIHRDSENAIIKRVGRPPSNCASFFLSKPLKGNRVIDPYNQVDAMLIARMKNLPTLNGYSGWTPRGWELSTVAGGYLQYVGHWASSKGITAGLCGLDLEEGSWTPIDFRTLPYLLGSTIDFHRGGNAHLYEAEGWGTEEDGGSWALGDHSGLILNLPAPPTTDLLFTLRAHAFTPMQRPSFEETVRVNGEVIADWMITGVAVDKKARVPQSLVRSGLLRVEFFNHDPRSPAEFGLSNDTRKLGLSFEGLKIVPAETETGYVLGSTIDFRWGGNAFVYETGGWAGAEDGGTWALGKHSALSLSLKTPPTTDLLLTLTAHAFTPEQRPKFHEALRVNDRIVADWLITGTQIQKSVRIPRSLLGSGPYRIEFSNDDPRSPAELGLSIDDRKLGLAIETIKLEAVESQPHL